MIWPNDEFGIFLTNKTWKNYQTGYQSLPWIEASTKLSEEQIKSSFLESWSLDIKDKFTQISFRHGITKYKLMCNLIVPNPYQSLTLKKPVLESGLLKKALRLLK